MGVMCYRWQKIGVNVAEVILRTIGGGCFMEERNMT